MSFRPLPFDLRNLSGVRVTVMGLGVHGGGVASAAFFARRGATVTVTDLRTESELSESMKQLAAFPLRYVLGRHDEADFAQADLVIKNPAVPRESPLLLKARLVESDISIFLRLAANPVVAITGSKGKSTTSAALFSVVMQTYPEAKLGGNITVSPLTFVDELINGPPRAPVVLELSSWQLADLSGKGLLKPKVAAITNIYHDHQNRYRSMEDYVADKRLVYHDQESEDVTLCNRDDAWGARFAAETPARVQWFSAHELPPEAEGGWLEPGGGQARRWGSVVSLLPPKLRLPGLHNRMNLLVAGLSALVLDVPAAEIRDRLASFGGLEHRLQYLADIDGVAFYNDSAATVPEAAVAAVQSFTEPVVLITGGTDKMLDFEAYRAFGAVPKKIVLLAGSATAKAVAVLESLGRSYRGPFGSLKEAVDCARTVAEPGDIVVFSPGAASFELFVNEFDRGRKFAALVAEGASAIR